MIQIKALPAKGRKLGLFTAQEAGMIGYVEAPRAWGLTRGMARVVGLDLVGAVTEGWLSRRELREMMQTCEGCDQSARCTAWLAVTPQAETLPQFCHNRPAIEALQP